MMREDGVMRIVWWCEGGGGRKLCGDEVNEYGW